MNHDLDHARAQIRIPGLTAMITAMTADDVKEQLAGPDQSGKPQSLAVFVTHCGCQTGDR